MQAAATVSLFKCDDPRLPTNCMYLELGRCGAVDPSGNPRAANFTKPNNPPRMSTPWLTPGAPNEPSFASTCLKKCGCVPYVGTAHHECTDPCTSSPCHDVCVACSVSFIAQQAAQATVDLYCDPSDADCAAGRPSRPVPRGELVLADFRPGSPTRSTWQDQNDPVMGGQSSSNFSVVDQGNESYGLFQGTVRNVPKLKAPGFAKIATITPAFKTVDISDYGSETGVIVLEVRYPAAHGGSGPPFKKHFKVMRAYKM